jgi:cyclic pyranopterin phosphate synthase
LGERLTHLGPSGDARMADVSGKPISARQARASARVGFPPGVLDAILEKGSPKGDLLGTARIAAIQAAKRTAELIPLCHPLPLTHVAVAFRVVPPDAVEVECEVRTEARTGVEMEALTGAAVGALTLYDMSKALDPGIVLREVRLLEKSGGKGGGWRAS